MKTWLTWLFTSAFLTTIAVQAASFTSTVTNSGGHSTICVNGKCVSTDGGGTVNVVNGKITVNGKDVMGIPSCTTTIKLEGPVRDVRSDMAVEANVIQGNVDANGSVQAKEIRGNVDANGSVIAGSIGGSAEANGSVIKH